MKFKTLKEIFEERLSVSSRFTSSRVSSVQSIQGAYIEAKKSSLTILTTNLSDFFHTSISATVEEEGSVVFDLKKALEFLNYLQPGEIEVKVEEMQLMITQGKTKGYFNIYPAGEFPDLPALEGKKYSLDTALLEKLSLVLFSASHDETRPVMTGVYTTSQDGNMYFVTTDGFRLSLLEHGGGEELPSTIIPAQILQEVVKLSKASDTVEMTLSPEDRLVMFTIGGITLYSRIIEGDFPPYEKVIPKSSTTDIEIHRQDFIKNIRLVSIFAREQADVVILDIKKDGMYIRPKVSQKKDSRVFQELESFKGEELKIAFNYKYVLDFLNALSSETEIVSLHCSQAAAPGLLKSENVDGYTHVIMPLRTVETTG